MHFAQAAGPRAALGRRPARRAPASNEGGQGAALFFLPGGLLREDLVVDVRVDGSEDQAPEFVRLQCFDLPLHRVVDVEAVTAGEGRPPGIAALALGRWQLVDSNWSPRAQILFTG